MMHDDHQWCDKPASFCNRIKSGISNLLIDFKIIKYSEQCNAADPPACTDTGCLNKKTIQR